MSNAARIPVPTVSPRGVALASRALFAYLGALLSPLMAQHLFGAHPSAAAIALAAGLGAIAGGTVGRLAARPARSGMIAAAGVILASMGVGLVAGVASGVVWATALDPHPVGREAAAVGVLFGAIFGVMTGACFSAPFAVWTARARAALDNPSAVRAQRLSMDAGVMLCAAGALAVLRYRDDVLSSLGAATLLVGTALTTAAFLRTLRLSRLHAAVERGELAVVRRGEHSTAPALVDVGPLDHVVAAPVDGAATATPFRANDPVREIAAVPADQAAVRRALGATVAYGLLTLALAGVFDASLAVRALSCCGGCPDASAQPCHGCDH